MVLNQTESELLSQVNVENEWRVLEKFSTLVRISGTEDEYRAADYIIKTLQSYGIPVNVYETGTFYKYS
jgi:N-acetylated-alpha-linked acidic dipeptidase